MTREELFDIAVKEGLTNGAALSFAAGVLADTFAALDAATATDMAREYVLGILASEPWLMGG